MVKDFKKIIEDADFKSDYDAKSLVFICANNPDFELPNLLLLKYPVFENYSEYWDKGRELAKRNNDLLEELYYDHSKKEALKNPKEHLSRTEKLKVQRKAIRKYSKENPF